MLQNLDSRGLNDSAAPMQQKDSFINSLNDAYALPNKTILFFMPMFFKNFSSCDTAKIAP